MTGWLPEQPDWVRETDFANNYLPGVILMAGAPWSVTEDWPEEIRECPMLVKPFTLDILARTVASLLTPDERRQTNGL